jgi:hypothetical protein
MENLLSDVPSAVKEFVEKNDTTGGGSFSENLDSVGNQNFNKEEESESVKEISPPHKASKKPLHTLEKQFEEEKFIFSQIGQEDVVWGKGILNKIEERSSIQSQRLVHALSVQKINQANSVHKTGPRIRLTACKKVPQTFEKFTWNSAQAKSASPSPIRDSTSEDSLIRAPICTPNLRGKQAQACDPCEAQFVFPARAATQPDPRGDPSRRCDPRLDPVCVTCNPCVFHQRPIRGSTRGPLDPVHPYPNWVWTRNPNLGFSSPSEVRFGPFKRRYDQYSEEHYSGGYPNPHFHYKRFQKGESSQSSQGFWQSPYHFDSSRGDQAYPRGNPYKYQ